MLFFENCLANYFRVDYLRSVEVPDTTFRRCSDNICFDVGQTRWFEMFSRYRTDLISILLRFEYSIMISYRWLMNV